MFTEQKYEKPHSCLKNMENKLVLDIPIPSVRFIWYARNQHTLKTVLKSGFR